MYNRCAPQLRRRKGGNAMRKSVRLIALWLCLVLLGTCVYAAEPIRPAEEVPSQELVSALPAETTEPAEPIETEPVETTEPEVTEPEVTEPEVTEPEVTEPEVTEPEVTEPTEPEPPEKPVSEMTDEEIIEKYSIPDYWARRALIFAVRTGIMVGKGDNNLDPGANITHAEVITILQKILNTQKQASMDRFTDVDPEAWYFGPMARAVSLGILPLADPNATTLTPGKLITREETFVAMARMFGVKGTNRQAIYRFADWKDVSDWAADDLAAMIETCQIAGDGVNLNPKGVITRAEVVQVLSRLLTQIGPTLDQTDFTGQMGLGGSYVAPNTTIHGDLLLSTDETSLTLEGLTVTGRLILQGNDKLNLNLLGCSIHELVLCRPVDLRSDSPLDTVTAYGFLTIFCNAQTVNVFDRMVQSADSTIQTVNAMDNTAISILGTVGTMNVLGYNVYINGSGRINTLVQRGTGLTNYCAVDSAVYNPYKTTGNAVATRTDNGKVSSKAPTLTMGLRLTNMPEGWSECDLVWFVDGKEISRTARNLLQEGSVITASYNFSSYLDGFHPTVPFTVYITHKGVQTLLYRGTVNLEESVQDIAKNVRTQNIQGQLRNSDKLYTSFNPDDQSFSGYKRNLSAGTRVTILQSREACATQVRLSDGTVGWTHYYNVAILSGTYYITQDYSTPVKEYFVNNVKNWGSSTGYMIWVSLYTQRINIFSGYRGHWTLIRSGPIASGRNDCPTPVEDVKLYYHTYSWVYDPYYVHHVTVFDEARGFHSRPTKYDRDGGGLYDNTIGMPASNGCIRLLDEDAIYVYNLPLNTAVHIY